MSIEGSMLADESFLRRAATLYYTEGEKQETVATLLYCSRQTISKALQKAEDRGIVRISVAPEERTGYLYDLARDLRFTLGLEELHLVPGCSFETIPPIEKDVMDAIMEAAACYLDQLLTQQDILAVTGGKAAVIARHLKPSKQLPTLQVVSAMGFVEKYTSMGDANTMACDIANVYGARYAWLPIPALVETQEQQDQARALPLVRDVFNMINRASIILISPWIPDHSMVKRGVLSGQQMEALQAYRPVVDIGYWMFDAEGSCVNERLQPCPYYLTGLEIPRLPEIIKRGRTKVILVAGGSKSHIQAIRAALKAGIVTTLITDHITALLLAKEICGGYPV